MADDSVVTLLHRGDRIVFLGASITEFGAKPGGYVTLVNKMLQARRAGLGLTVINAGISGNRVPDLQNRLDRDVLTHHPTIVVIYIGINDVWHWDQNRGTTKEDFETGLIDLIKRIRAADSRVILCTPSVIGEKTDGTNSRDAMLEDYAQVSRRVAALTQSQLIDLRQIFLFRLKSVNQQNVSQGILTEDGVHLNKAGNRLAADSMLAALGVIELFPGPRSEYRGYDRYDFEIDGCPAIVVAPKEPAPDKPWIWRAEFFDAFPETDLALLDQGFYLTYLSVGNTFGCPDALAHWDVFYRELTGKYGLTKKVALEGLSRGGLYVFNWAAANPEKISCIYGDNAVCDFKSWPGGKGKSAGSPSDWQKLIRDYHFESEAQALSYKKNPIDNLRPLAEAKIPLFLLCADADQVVPYAENGAIVKERYEKLGGPVTVMIKNGMEHHPHGLTDPEPIVRFILEHTPGSVSEKKSD